MKTVLRYPGGKSRAVKHLMPYIPDDVNTICSPFFGGGALELTLANKGIKVVGYDSFDLLVDFWQCVIERPQELAEEVEKLHPLSMEDFRRLQETIYETPIKIVRAAMFYALNRSSFSGTTLSGGMSTGHPRFNRNSIERLRNFNATNISVEKADFKESLKINQGKFLYCDPPYYIDNKLYGYKGDKHKDFDHEGLAAILKNRRGWVLSYNDCEYIRNLYRDFRIDTAKWSYGMNRSKKSSEIIISSY